MSVGEIYFLIFVCGSFAALSIALAVASIRYYQWRGPALGATSRLASRTERRAG